MWAAIALTVAAAAGNNIGKALQKQATKTLPRLSLTPEVLRLYAASSTWLIGMAADLGGAVLMIQAFAMAPVSIVQPVSSVGLAFLMAFSHFYLQERLSWQEWAAAGTAVLGIVCLGASSSSSTSTSTSTSNAAPSSGAGGSVSAPSDAGVPAVPGTVADASAAAAAPPVIAPPEGPSPAWIAFSFLVFVAAIGGEVYWRQQRRRSKAHKSGSSVQAQSAAAADAAACGLEAGVCFGLSAASCRTGFQLAASLGWLLVPLGLVCSVCMTSAGMVLQTRGFKSGTSIVVCTMAAASGMVSGVVVGLVVLGEQLPSSRGQQALRLLAWLLILLGVGGLAGAGGRENLLALARPLLERTVRLLPPRVRAQLPASVQAALKQEGLLPVVGSSPHVL